MLPLSGLSAPEDAALLAEANNIAEQD